MTDLLKVLEDNCWDLRCVTDNPAPGDYKTTWRVIEYYERAPIERILGTGKTPAEAILDAIKETATCT